MKLWSGHTHNYYGMPFSWYGVGWTPMVVDDFGNASELLKGIGPFSWAYMPVGDDYMRKVLGNSEESQKRWKAQS